MTTPAATPHTASAGELGSGAVETARRLLAELNDRQREAVEHGHGPMLVLAGPGSGKTRVLTRRVAWLAGVEGVEPWRILAVTFTNKAAREMRERIESLLGQAAVERLTVGTFHATCARILRQAAADGNPFLPVDRNFAIFDADDQLRAVKRAMAELNVDTKEHRPSAVLGIISGAKNEMIGPDRYVPRSHNHEHVPGIYTRYQAILRSSNALDFDDLLVETARLVDRDPDTRDRLRRRYRHVLVDEFQDTNAAQYLLLRSLAAVEVADAPHNIFVVGDEDQSVYRWRGADYRNLERFRADFPDARTVLLEQNYRSTQVILDAAGAVIDRNLNRTPKRLWTDAGLGEPIELHEAQDEGEEAHYVARRIAGHTSRGATLGDIAVMYRTNAQSRALEEALLRAGLPYQLVGATRFYDRREVRDILAFLKLVHNPDDEIALQRIINVPRRGIGKSAWSALVQAAQASGESLWRALERLVGHGGDLPSAGAPMPDLDTRSRRALRSFYNLLSGLLEQRSTSGPSELISRIIDATDFETWLRDGTDEGDGRWENVQELRSVATGFDHVDPELGRAAFLERAALISDIDAVEEGVDRVTLMTLHAAKGLEFPIVFLTGLEEEALPHSRSANDLEGLAEERRLFYVGITRAARKLYLLHAARRNTFGRWVPRNRSRFVDDLPAAVLGGRAAGGTQVRRAADRAVSWPSGNGGRGGARPSAGGGALGGASTPAPALSDGDKVAHPTFGNGVVISTRDAGDDLEVQVVFASAGVKTLLASLAKLTRR